MADYDGSIRINTKITTNQVEKELKNLESNISKTADKIASLRSKMDSLKDVKIPTQEYQEVQKQIELTEKKINDLLARQERFLATGGKETSSVYKRMQYDIEELQSSLPFLKSELQDLIDSGKSFTLGSDTEKYSQMSAEMQKLNQQMESDTQRQSELQSALSAEEQRLADIKANATVSDQEIINLMERRKQILQEIADLEKAGVGLGYKEYEDKNRELAEINSSIRDYKKNLEGVPEKFEKMRNSAKKAFDAASEGTKKSTGLFSSFASRMKGLALSLLIFNWISNGFNAMISGMKAGFSNFAGYSDSYAQSIQNMKNAMSTLGNQFAAAFAPIVQMVIPWINSLINVLTTAMTYVAQFFAVLSGKSTFTKAKKVQDSYNKSLGGTAKAADKARGALAKFDDLDVLEKKDDAGGGGGGGAGEDFGDMFEEVPVDYKVQTWLDGIIDRLNVLKGIFSKGFWDGLGDWGARWESIKESISSIKDNLIDIWTDPAVVSSAQAWSESVIYMLGALAGSVTSIGLTIAANILGGIETYLDENKDRIKGFLVSMFDIGTEVNNMFSELFSSIAFVFEAFASEQGQQLTANIIGIFADYFMGILEIASKFARDILNIFIEPFVENKEEFRAALEGFLGVLSDVAGTIKQGIDDTFSKLNEIYDEHFKPFFDSVAEGLTILVEHFLTFWNEQVQPILEEWAEGFDLLWQEHIQPMINNFIELLGQAADFLKEVWENIIMPFVQWIIDNILPVILPIIDGVVKALMVAAGGIADAISGVIDIFKGLLTFLSGVFAGDWDKAWQGITQIVEGVKNTIKGIINAILGAVEAMANGVVKAVNKIIDAINSLEISNPFTGEEIWSPNIRPIPSVSIPRLATGAVIRGGNPFMAILGDQPKGQTNIEAPLDTIRQAVREELSSTNLGGSGGGSLQVVLNVNGEDLARATINDWLSELSRQGYDVSVLGVT